MGRTLEQVLASLTQAERDKVDVIIAARIANERKAEQQQANQRQFHQEMLKQAASVGTARG